MKTLLFILLLVSTQASAEECKEVQFTKGQNSVALEGVIGASDTASACYTLQVKPGQHAMVDIKKPNMAFTIEDGSKGADDRIHYNWQTETSLVRITVFQQWKAVKPLPYTLKVTIN